MKSQTKSSGSRKLTRAKRRKRAVAIPKVKAKKRRRGVSNQLNIGSFAGRYYEALASQLTSASDIGSNSETLHWESGNALADLHMNRLNYFHEL